MYCNSLLPHITSPTCITVIFKTLKDNIFLDDYDFTLKYGNILINLSDHNTQFLFIKNQIIVNKKTDKQYYRDFTAMEKKEIKLTKNYKTYIGQPNKGSVKTLLISPQICYKKKKNLKRFLGTLRTNCK